MNKEIMKVALDRLDTVITEMNATTSTITRIGFAGVAHDLVRIIKLASDKDENIGIEEKTC